MPATCGYGYFWYPHVNGAGTSIIVDGYGYHSICTHGYSYPLNFNSQKYPYIYISKKHFDLIFSTLHILSCLLYSFFQFQLLVRCLLPYIPLDILLSPLLFEIGHSDVYSMLVVKWWNHNKNTWHVSVEVYYLFIFFLFFRNQ